jgi:hypothetical protein
MAEARWGKGIGGASCPGHGDSRATQAANVLNEVTFMYVDVIYPLVNVYITVEHHHVSWETQLF